ncbi:MAG TPA: hypothetical protein VF487_12470 [Chitinophagaceae bacterium]
MKHDNRTIPLSIAKLLLGFYSRTNNEVEKDTLGDWLSADDAKYLKNAWK